MLELRSLQRAFWAVLTDADGAGDAADAGLDGAVRGDARMAARARLAVYANMYFCRLRDNLAADFPRLAAVTGAHDFDLLIADYLAAHPSRHPSVRHLGAALPQFLRSRACARPWLADLAALEWARLDVFDREAQPTLTHAQLRDAAAHGFGGLALRTITAHARVDLAHDVTEIWRQSADCTHDVAASPTRCVLLVWRAPDERVHHRLVCAEEAELLHLLRDGIDFTALCVHLCAGRSDQEAALRALALVSAWTAEGLLRA